MKKVLPLLLSAALLFSLAACGTGGNQDVDGQSADDQSMGNASAFENPFAQEQPQDSSLSHGMQVTDPERKPEIAYNGGECRVNYSVSASGIGRDFGFLLYVDGIPQPYKLKPEGEYAYLHPVSLAEDAEDQPFTFYFVPVTGVAGTPSTLAVTSLTNPLFQPDMVETSSYGGYHGALTAEYPIRLAADPPPFPEQVAVNKCIINMNCQALPVTSDYLETRGWSLGQLNKGIYQFIAYNGEVRYDNLAVSGDAPTAIHYELAGIPGMRSQTTFYIDHTPIADADGRLVFDNTFSSGEVIAYDFEIDPAILNEFSTFYAVTVPLDTGNYPDDPISTLKTESILLWNAVKK